LAAAVLVRKHAELVAVILAFQQSHQRAAVVAVLTSQAIETVDLVVQAAAVHFLAVSAQAEQVTLDHILQSKVTQVVTALKDHHQTFAQEVVVVQVLLEVTAFQAQAEMVVQEQQAQSLDHLSHVAVVVVAVEIAALLVQAVLVVAVVQIPQAQQTRARAVVVVLMQIKCQVAVVQD
jgi:hypothetical protein